MKFVRKRKSGLVGFVSFYISRKTKNIDLVHFYLGLRVFVLYLLYEKSGSSVRLKSPFLYLQLS